MLTESQYRGAAVGMSTRVCNSKSVCSPAQKLDSYECHSLVSYSHHTERSLGFLSACPQHRETL